MSEFRVLFNEEQIQRQVKALGARITEDFRGQTLDVVCLVDTGHIFMADLLRVIDLPVRTHFMSMTVRDVLDPNYDRARHEIFFYPEIDSAGRSILVVDGVLQTGITLDFLLRRIWLREPVEVRTCILVDKQLDRRVLLEPDYVGFQLDTNDIVVGYGLSWRGLDGNRPNLGVVSRGGGDGGDGASSGQEAAPAAGSQSRKKKTKK